MAISQRSFEITSAEGAGLACYLAMPDGGSGPGLLLLHDSDGLNDHAKHLANLYAEEGWVVASPDLGQQTDAEFALQLATTALSALAAVAETSGDIGVLGHGPGAGLALLLASCDVRVRCAVGFTLRICTPVTPPWRASIARYCCISARTPRAKRPSCPMN